MPHINSEKCGLTCFNECAIFAIFLTASQKRFKAVFQTQGQALLGWQSQEEGQAVILFLLTNTRA